MPSSFRDTVRWIARRFGLSKEMLIDPELRREMSLVRPFFAEHYYLELYDDVRQAGADPLKHYCEHGWREGRNPRPDFSTTDYIRDTSDYQAGQGNPFAHAVRLKKIAPMSAEAQRKALAAVIGRNRSVLRRGYVTATLPDGSTQRFDMPPHDDIALMEETIDADYYRARYPDVDASGLTPAQHYLLIGGEALYDPSPEFSAQYYMSQNGDVARAGNIVPYLHYQRHGKRERWRVSASVATQAMLEKFGPGGPLEADLKAAIALDPMVALPDSVGRRLTSPLINAPGMAGQAETLRRHFAGRRFSHVVMIPHVRMSGAARVAGSYAAALARAVGVENVLVVMTDGSDMEHPEWFPEGCEIFDLASVLDAAESNNERRFWLMLDVLHGVGAEVVTNINSRLMWDALQVYGKQMSQEFRLLTYLFTWDESLRGNRVGYPVQWLRQTVAYLDCIMCDSENLANDIRTRFGFAPESGRIRVLHSPIDADAEIARARRPDAGRILWAGRLDRQKRPDILAAIAAQNPDLNFEVYGRAVLSSGESWGLEELPNVTMMGEYSDLSEVLERGYDAFLYTSQWDGMPTIVLDMIRADLPVIAPDVGGLAELIGPDTGWLIEDHEDVAGFSAALREILGDRDEGARRCEGARARLREVFHPARYDAAVAEIVTGSGSDAAPRQESRA